MEKKRCYGCMRIKTSTPFCEHCGHDERNRNAPHQLPAGTVLREQYLVGKVLGQGGFGITYLGWDLYLDIPVAIKEYYPTGMVMRETTQTFSVINCLDDDGDRFHNNRDRFMREAKMLARFSYVPEIVQIKNFFLANNTAYIVMEYVQGITLKEYIRRRGGRLSVQETFAILQPIMVGLSKIHKAGLIHRDISPDNIMMLPGGGAKLLDFGAVRDVGTVTVNEELSRPTDAILKQGYAPIEQYQQKGALGPWSDVYALCATVYYCLTGTVPPDSPARMLEEEKVTFDPRIGLDKRQTKALIKGMAIRAADRTRNMEELYQDLFGSAIPQDEDGPRPENPVDPPKIPSNAPKPRGKGWIVALVAVLLIACGIGAWFLTRPREARLADRIPTEETEQTAEETEQTLPTQEELPPVTTAPKQTEPTQPQRPVVKNADENTLMEHPVDSVENGPANKAFGTSVARDQVSSITVLYTTQDAPTTAVDVSMNGNGKVLAWVEENGTLYDLYLAAEGGIYAPANSEYLFAFFTNAKTFNFNDALYTDNVENASGMFYNDIALVQMDISAFRTGRVTDMSWMFSGCENLEALDVSGFDTSSVVFMNSMFQSCGSLHQLDVSNFDTANVTTMRYMFTKCSSLEKLDVSGFDTGNVTQMQMMFNACSGLEELDVSGFRTANVQDMSSMFAQCSGIRILDVSGFVTSGVTDMGSMFRKCSSLTQLDVSGFTTSGVTDMSCMFQDCSSLTVLDVSGFDTVRVTDMTCMFMNCSGLETLDVSGFTTANVSSMSTMFSGCTSLTQLDVSGFKTGNVTDMGSMFGDCSSLTVLNVSGFQTGNVTTMRAMFEGCSNVGTLAVGGFNTSKVKDMSYMFNRCHKLEALNLVHWDTVNVTEMIATFRECKAITRLNLSTFNTRNVTSMARMFENCSGLTYLNISGLETHNVTDMEYMFSGCSGLASLSVSSFSTAKSEDMQYMFHECRSLRSLDISRFDTTNVINMNYMLYGCDSLTDLKLGKFNTANVCYNDNFMETGKLVNGQDWTTLF